MLSILSFALLLNSAFPHFILFFSFFLVNEILGKDLVYRHSLILKKYYWISSVKFYFQRKSLFCYVLAISSPIKTVKNKIT